MIFGICSTSYAQKIDQIPLRTIDGDTVYLEQFVGKKVLIVNSASKCGYTPQYGDLERLYQKNKHRLVILAFPTDNFMKQEFDNEAEIKTFCTTNYDVTFPIMGKVDVKGNDIHPLFQALLDEKNNDFGKIKIKWNFHKILLNEEHKIIGSFSSGVSPLSEKLINLL